MLKAFWCWWDQNFWSRWPSCKTLFILTLCSLVILIKNLIPSTSGGLEHLKQQCSAVRSSWPKLLNLSEAGGLGHPFDFTSFSTIPLVFSCSFFIPGVFFLYDSLLFLEICIGYVKDKYSQLIRVLVVTTIATYPCISTLFYGNFVTSAASPVIAHSAIIASNSSIAHCVTSVTCPIYHNLF